MTPNVEDDIKKIVARSFPNDTEERRILEKVFSALSKHQEKFLADLEQRIDTEINTPDWKKNFEIAVKFVKPEDEESKRELFKIEVGSCLIFAESHKSPFAKSLGQKKEKNSSQESFFIYASYNEIENFCAPKKYQGRIILQDGTAKNFSYTLQRHERFIKQEKILFEIAALYQINRPVIFSPYARKAVDIKVSGVTENDFKNCSDFQLLLEENNLDGKLLKGGLYWNVNIEPYTTLYSNTPPEEYIGADGILIRYEEFHTFNADENIFVLPAQHCDNFNLEIKNGERKITLSYNSVFKERDCQKITLVDFEKNDAEIFTNDFPRPNEKLRLNTEGDVEKVLSCFNATRAGQNFPAKFESFNAKNFKPLTIYRREDKYFVHPETHLLGKVRNKPVCVINFGGEKSIFKIDYANFVIHYLEQNYPEFNWAGVET